MIEFHVIVIMIVTMTVQILYPSSRETSWTVLMTLISVMLLALIMTLSLRAIRKQEEENLKGLVLNNTLMLVHEIAFICLTVVTLVLTALQWEYEKVNDLEEKSRLGIGFHSIKILALLSVSIVQYIMVFVFLRFGKPLEDDDLKLVREKIISIHVNRETERLDPVKSAFKKHDELRKLANIEIALSL